MSEPISVVTSSPLTTPDRVESALGAPVDPDRVAALIARSSAAFRSATGQDISASTSTVVIDDDGANSVLLAQLPVTDVLAVLVDDVELARGDYRWSPDGIVDLPPGPSFTAGHFWRAVRRRRVAVTYAHGYADIPAAVAEAVAEHAAAAYRTTPGVTQLSLGSSSFTFGTGAYSGARAGDSLWATAVARYRSWLP